MISDGAPQLVTIFGRVDGPYEHQGGRKKFWFHQLLCTTNISAWFCHQMMARKINYFVNALLIVMAQADCKNHLLITSFVTD
jgi:hypothetical protein